ncbi:MAG: hypothetical protein ACJAUH_001772, partial [Saprospiraceae bacterium]
VLENGETLVGQIQMLSPTMNEVKVKFIASNGKAKTYKANEVAAYSFAFPKYDAKTKTYKNTTIEYVKKEVTVAPIPFGPKSVLVERQVAGTVNLYNFYSETRAAEHAFAHNYFVEKNGQMIEMNRENFKTILKDMVSDYPELQVKVGKKGYGYRQIAQTIEEYNEYSAPKGAFLGMN